MDSNPPLEQLKEGLRRTIEEVENLPPEEKKEYYRLVIRKILRENPGGIRIQEISKITGFNRKTVTAHLEFLMAVREAYGREPLFFPNGRLAHPYSDRTAEIGDSFFTFRQVANQFGDYLYVQEKKKEPGNLLTIVGGIMIRKDVIEEFTERLKEAAGAG